MAQRQFPSPYRYDAAQNLRVIAQVVTFERLVDQAFNPIRQYAQSDSAVTIRLLVAITRIAEANCYASYQFALRRHAEMILRGSEEGLSEEHDRQAVEKWYDRAIAAIEQNEFFASSDGFCVGAVKSCQSDRLHPNATPGSGACAGGRGMGVASGNSPLP